MVRRLLTKGRREASLITPHLAPLTRKAGLPMRRTLLLLATMALTLLVASGVALAVTKIGTDGPDTLRGTNKADNLAGRGGNDKLLALAGKDNLLGGSGKDAIYGGPGNDAILGGVASDVLVGGDGNDFIYVGGIETGPKVKAHDRVLSGGGNDVVIIFNDDDAEDIAICGAGIDRVLTDDLSRGEDTVAPDCEKVFVGRGAFDEFDKSIPQSFWNGLPEF